MSDASPIGFPWYLGAASAVLVDENRVAVRVGQHEARRAGRGLVRLLIEGRAGGLELALELADVGERVDRLRAWSQPGLKVRRFLSNIPWNSPMTTSPFLSMSQPCATSPWNWLKPSRS